MRLVNILLKGSKKTTTLMRFRHNLQLHDLGVGEYLNNKYALWLDFRIINENSLYGTGVYYIRSRSGL